MLLVVVALVAKLCLTLATPWTEEPGRLQIIQARILEWVAISVSEFQELNSGLLHRRQILYQLSYKRSLLKHATQPQSWVMCTFYVISKFPLFISIIIFITL